MPSSPMPFAWFIAMWRDGLNPTETADGPIAFEGGDEAFNGTIPLDLTIRSVACIISPPQGLGVPEVRSGDVIRAQRDGVLRTADWYGSRTVTFQVEVKNEGCPGCPSARTQVRLIERAWSRTAWDLGSQSGDAGEGNWLLIYPDNYDPANVGTEAQQWTGPYLMFGRPRGCEVVWHRSDQGRATISLRFDAYDHRLILPEVSTGLLDPFTFEPSSCRQIYGPGGGTSPTRLNLAQNPGVVNPFFEDRDATVTRTHPASAGPQSQGYEQFQIDVAATISPFFYRIGGTGVNAIPVNPGEFYTVSSYWWKNQAVGAQRMSVNFWDSGGNLIGTQNPGGSSLPFSLVNAWERFWGALEVPVNAAFMEPLLVWSGGAAYPVGFIGRNAGVLVERDYEATTLGEVVAPHWFFMGDYYGDWLGTPDDSPSITSATRRNLSLGPRGDTATAWLPSWSGGVVSEAVITAGDAPTNEELPALEGSSPLSTYIRYTVTTASVNDFFALNIASNTRHGAYQSEAPGTDRAYCAIAVRVSRSGLTSRGLGAGLLDNNSLDTSTGTAQQPLVPGEWLVHTYTARADASWVGFAPAVWIEGGTLQVGDTIDVTAGYTEAEEFYEQPTLIRGYFDGDTTGAEWTPAEPLGSMLLFQLGDGLTEEGMVITGTECAFPNIIMTGPLIAPITVTFRDSVREFSVTLTDDLPTDEDRMFIDLKNKVGFPFGPSTTGNYLTWSGEVGPLGPGPVDVFVQAAGGTGTVEICWEDAVIGG